MFERFTQKARRVIFFARYEASTFSSPYIEVEHMLLGMLLVCVQIRGLLDAGVAPALRERLARGREDREPIATTVDLPLSMDAKRMLSLAAREAARLGHQHIDCGHLFAGMLQLEHWITHDFLEDQTGSLGDLRQRVSEQLQAPSVTARRRPEWGPETAIESLDDVLEPTPAPEFASSRDTLATLLSRCAGLMDCHTESYGNTKLHRRPWTRKQALGYLIDNADQTRLWLARALTEPFLRVDRVPSEESAAAQPYNDMRWPFVVACWFNANHLLLRVIGSLPGSEAKLSCRIGIEAPITLQELVAHFVGLTEDIMEQVLARL
jgi:hypothetical protein